MMKTNITVAIAPETPTTGKDTKTFIMHKLWFPNHAPISKHYGTDLDVMSNLI